MTALRESARWEQIYQVQLSDPVQGGVNGVCNIQARQLACRTLLLKALLASAHDASGGHALTQRDVAADAAIPERSLALDMGTQALYDACLALRRRIEQSGDSVDNLDLETPLHRALLAAWRYGPAVFDFELFIPPFEFQDSFTDAPVIQTVAGDDTILVADTSELREGQRYLFQVGDHQEFITIGRILGGNTVLAVDPVAISTDSEDHGALYGTTWERQDRKALAAAGSVYYSDSLDALQYYEYGIVSIGHSGACAFVVRYKRPSDPEWLEAEYLTTTEIAPDVFRSQFKVMGEDFITLEIVAQQDTTVDHIAIMPTEMAVKRTTVRTPLSLEPFRVTRYGCIYAGAHVETEVQIATDSRFSNPVTLHLEPRACTATVCDISSDVRSAYQFAASVTYWWRVRYRSSDGYWSFWSEPSSFQEPC